MMFRNINKIENTNININNNRIHKKELCYPLKQGSKTFLQFNVTERLDIWIALLTDNSVLYDAMAKSNRQDWFVWNTNVSEFAKSCLSELTVNIEHKGVLDRLERHEGVQRLAPQGPPVINNARPKLKQGEIIFLKSSQKELNNNDATQSTN